MANAFTDTSAPAFGAVTALAYDRVGEFALRDQPQYRQLIDKRPTDQAMPGTSVTLTIHKDLPNLATTPLTETVDPDTVASPAPNQVNVVLNEYGLPEQETLKLRTLSFTDVDAAVAMQLMRNQLDTMDALVRAVADTGTNIIWKNGGALTSNLSGGSDAAVATGDTFGRNQASAAVSLLNRRKAMPKMGNSFVALIHPDVQFDILAENSATAWIGAAAYGGAVESLYAGEIGTLLGARYIETTRVTMTNTGAGGIPVYTTYFMGREAIVEACAIEPHSVIGPQTDHLRRFYPIGWYGLLGWNIYRNEALQKVRTTSSIRAL